LDRFEEDLNISRLRWTLLRHPPLSLDPNIARAEPARAPLPPTVDLSPSLPPTAPARIALTIQPRALASSGTTSGWPAL